jgi:hypothetical protein
MFYYLYMVLKKKEISSKPYIVTLSTKLAEHGGQCGNLFLFSYSLSLSLIIFGFALKGKLSKKLTLFLW